MADVTLLLLNGGDAATAFALPGPVLSWRVLFDTSHARASEHGLPAGDVELAPHSAVLLGAVWKKPAIVSEWERGDAEPFGSRSDASIAGGGPMEPDREGRSVESAEQAATEAASAGPVSTDGPADSRQAEAASAEAGTERR